MGGLSAGMASLRSGLRTNGEAPDSERGAASPSVSHVNTNAFMSHLVHKKEKSRMKKKKKKKKMKKKKQQLEISQACDRFNEAALTLRRAVGTGGLPSRWLS